jgi:phage FluMu gp28-like protein
VAAIDLLPYQVKCFHDRGRFKALMWSRGARKTFTVTLEIVDDCFDYEARRKRTTWVILSRGERQAKEAIEECKRHCTAYLMGSAAIHQSEFVSEDGLRRFTQLEIRFPGGSRIIALPANPDTARGYTANVFLDEFCIHEHDVEIWRSLLPVLRGRFRVVVASTPKGGRNRKFYQIINDVSGLWSKHVVDVYEAVAQGLPLNIEQEKAAMADPDGWAQEFELQWLDEASAWLPFDLIASCEDADAGKPELYDPRNLVFIGNDIGRRRDLWVAWVIEKVGDVLWTREVVELENKKFAEHDEAMHRLFATYRVARLGMDQTGMGEKPVEDYQRWFGANRVEGVLFTGPNKQGLATIGKQAFEQRRVRIPGSAKVRDDLYKLKKSVTLSGSVRFDAERDENGHADRAWALFLALNAADLGYVPIEYESVKSREDLGEEQLMARSSFDGY